MLEISQSGCGVGLTQSNGPPQCLGYSYDFSGQHSWGLIFLYVYLPVENIFEATFNSHRAFPPCSFWLVF